MNYIKRYIIALVIILASLVLSVYLGAIVALSWGENVTFNKLASTIINSSTILSIPIYLWFMWTCRQYHSGNLKKLIFLNLFFFALLIVYGYWYLG